MGECKAPLVLASPRPDCRVSRRYGAKARQESAPVELAGRDAGVHPTDNGSQRPDGNWLREQVSEFEL